MSFRTRLISIGILTLISASTGASATDLAHWAIISQSSVIRFSGSQMGQPFVGRFERLNGRIDFEPGLSPKGNVHVDIDIPSIKTGADDRDSMALGEDWFIAKRFPKAAFDAQVFVQTGPDAYEADGELTIRGITTPVILPFTLHVLPTGEADMESRMSLDRLKFGLGTGHFADPALVSQNIALEIAVHAKRVP